MTILIELDDREYADLQSDAATSGVTPEQLARRRVVAPSGPTDGIDDATFRTAMTASFRENDELYRRLAK